ncbi:beta-lactamase regulating signal transducer with metallopeptidase domain [Pelomonas saccharophila]|uniref:Beta-lactamase regulating signal transducer with metallopeptidase domain n=1 Tax=Roseateles saccharophilus TaxID=304 RepID=A0ABU1YKS1_ROSSA|nr:M56 family metallopeptidase [Roseateles saccharophilus]MDR7268586.1 beta-lactamase regulating signal transducer with metallopeptidase domain [Roseateles saccharophilus]
MSELLLSSLLRQALLLSAAVLLLWALHRPLLRLGASAAYASWLLLPLLLLTPALPRPGREPLQRALQAATNADMTELPAVVAPATDHAALWLVLWLAGAAVVVAVQARRQWQLGRFGERLPAGRSPALVGLLRPHVALPADFEQRFSAAERELILAHEQVHRERGDNLWNLLACALTALHWWNPLAWWAARRMQADQELACDAAVLARYPGSRPTYTQALMTAHHLMPARAPLASRWGSSHPLVERITMLNRSRTLPRRRAAALALALLGVAGLAYAAQTPPQAASATQAAQPQKVEIRLNVTSGAFKAAPRLITALGERSSLQWGGTAAQSWRLDFTVTRGDDGKLQVLTQPSYGGKALGEHKGVLASGESFGQRIGGSDGVPALQMTRVVTLLPADFKMPSHESKPRS